MKTCTGCHKDKPLSEFRWANKEKTRRRGECKTCCSDKEKARKEKWLREKPEEWAKARRDASIKHKYGVTAAQFDAMLLVQQGLCAICGEEMDNPYVDHCHSTNEVRGLLCNYCNTGLGMFKDNTDNLLSAIKYLEAHRD
jgi:hypothetical protein